MLDALRDKLRSAREELRHDSELWRRAIRFGAVRGPDAFVRYSPPLFGVAWAAALPHARRKVQGNLVRAGARGTPLEVAKVFSTYALALTEAFAIGSGRSERLRARIVGDSEFARARADGRGVIVATAHTSGWYAAGPILGSVYDDDVLLVMQEERDSAAQRIQAAQRAELGLQVVHVGADPLAAMPLLGHLRRGGVVAVQADRVPEGQRAAYADELVQVPVGPLQLAAVSGAPIVVVLGRRLGFLDYEVTVTSAIRVPRRPTQDELGASGREICERIGAFVRAHPTDWFHF
jgi:KDO2-lipid IV(A) lauroyltransferase